MRQKILDYMEEHHMTDPGDHLLVGLSGGADSVALLILLDELKSRLGITLCAVHVEHGIRGVESLRDAAFAEKLCEKLSIPYVCCRVEALVCAREQGIGVEEAARILRYQEFRRAAASWEESRTTESRAESRAGGCGTEEAQGGYGRVKIALAHHREDNAETILFHLARGSGIVGLCGIAPVRKEGELLCIRPLLGSSRGEIEEYLNGIGQSWCLDSTNLIDDYTRNHIRHKLIPELLEVNSRAVEHIGRSAAQLSLIRDFLGEQTKEAYNRIAEEKESDIILPIEELKALHPALRMEVLKEALFRKMGKRKDIGAAHLKQLYALMELQSGSRMDFPFGVTACREYGNLRISAQRAGTEENAMERTESERSADEMDFRVTEKQIVLCGEETLEIFFGEAGESLVIKQREYVGTPEEIVKKTYTKSLDYDMIKDGFSIRHRRPGDYLVCDGQGHRKRIKEYFIEEKIPVSEREDIWLLARESEVIWVIGGRIGENYKINADTKRVAVLDYRPGKGQEAKEASL